MELKKTNERWNRTFDNEGASSELLESVQYEIRDNEGNPIGNASVNQGSVNLNINLYGFNTVEEGVEKLVATLGIGE